ncbi:MAG: PilZ domain-containing protein [Bdellovibrio sp.]
MSAIAKRYNTNEKAQVEVMGRMGVLVANLRNISQTGAFLEVRQGSYIPKKGDFLNVTVDLADLQRTHKVAAEVIWSNGLGVGICFINNKEDILEKVIAKGTDF